MVVAHKACMWHKILWRWWCIWYFSSVTKKMRVHWWFSFSLHAIKSEQAHPKRWRQTDQGISIYFGVWLSPRKWAPWGQWSYFLHCCNSRTYKRPWFRTGSSIVGLTCKFKYSLYELQFSPPYLTRTTTATTTAKICGWFFTDDAPRLVLCAHFLS